MNSRRVFLSQSLGAAATPATPAATPATIGSVKRRPGSAIRAGINAYSFNAPLTAGSMTLFDQRDLAEITRGQSSHLQTYPRPVSIVNRSSTEFT